MTMFFGFMTALVSIGAGVLMVMLIVRGFVSADRTRKEAFELALQKGIYDPAIIRPAKKRGGNAALGWGIALLGIGLIIFHVIVKRNAVDIEENGKPVQLAPSTDQTGSVAGQDQ